ncbi:PAS domain S-box protein [Streptomyces armeniacus]|uniref:PAS domain S-box protein n=1 Tax=Streptomyces armeniacus TaxID=83291 RepID=A0A345Y0L0_9ACTN|nr:PAS domain S-box protein [Streptomyces armeniacus]
MRVPVEGHDATHAVVVADTGGTITQWNAGAEAMFGYAAADAVGRSLDLIVPRHLREAHWRGFHRAMADPKVRDLAADLPVRCADGEIRSFAGRLLVLSDGLGTALGALAVYARAGSTGVRPFD